MSQSDYSNFLNFPGEDEVTGSKVENTADYSRKHAQKDSDVNVTTSSLTSLATQDLDVYGTYRDNLCAASLSSTPDYHSEVNVSPWEIDALDYDIGADNDIQPQTSGRGKETAKRSSDEGYHSALACGSESASYSPVEIRDPLFSMPDPQVHNVFTSPNDNVASEVMKPSSSSCGEYPILQNFTASLAPDMIQRVYYEQPPSLSMMTEKLGYDSPSAVPEAGFEHLNFEDSSWISTESVEPKVGERILGQLDNEDATPVYQELDQANEETETPEELQNISFPSTFQNSAPIEFALWGLRNLIPDGKNFHDKASILHATADYIEKLHHDIQSCFHQLGSDNVDRLLGCIRQNIMKPSKKQESRSRKRVLVDNRLKRPPNPFIRFSVDFRRMVANDFPTRNNREISQLLGTIWHNMSAEDKQPYIEQFYNDMEKQKKAFPDWRYCNTSGIKDRLGDVEIKTERLRPRSSSQLKYKDVLTFKHGTSSKARNKKREETLTSEKIKQEPVTWVQCDKCNKWRKMTQLNQSTAGLTEQWTCSMNVDPDHNSCAAEEESE